MTESVRVAIGSDIDIVRARQQVRTLAKEVGFTSSELTLIVTALSELARNIVEYARSGEIILDQICQGTRRGLSITARDGGPGIADIDLAMRDGYSSGKGLGLGLPGTKRLMDDFEITSEVGHGTQVKVTKWTH
ncbi:anti-sigma regulatory factor [Methyloterricola oryzae]|uniref:anti-sigma regulatory factor n=1 Tax=Methyloterricola oryzae TaxID=1495050 RepID=UPI0005EBEBA6|nr:anti-sigma regulatory factor [Methyloterricola oryzae]